MKRRKSNRKYPEQLCLNPNCDFGSKFTPYDSRQKFCCEQCRINYYNDLRKSEDATVFEDERVLRKINKQLKLFYVRYFNGNWCSVHIGFFAHAQIDILNYLVKKGWDKITGTQISWFYEYGVSVDLKNPSYILVHKKTIQ